jgi:biopolymer transport protein ExbD
MEFKRRRYNHSYLNIAPLVDVVFLLLLFFMLTSHLVEEPAVKVKLPASRTADSGTETVPTVLITKNGDLYFQDQKISIETLGQRIKESLSGTEDKRVRIKADRDVKLSVLIRVIDEIRFAGVRDFGIVTIKGD